MPVPGVERMAGFTTTMYDIVRNAVMPAMMSRCTRANHIALLTSQRRRRIDFHHPACGRVRGG